MRRLSSYASGWPATYRSAASLPPTSAYGSPAVPLSTTQSAYGSPAVQPVAQYSATRLAAPVPQLLGYAGPHGVYASSAVAPAAVAAAQAAPITAGYGYAPLRHRPASQDLASLAASVAGYASPAASAPSAAPVSYSGSGSGSGSSSGSGSGSGSAPAVRGAYSRSLAGTYSAPAAAAAPPAYAAVLREAPVAPAYGGNSGSGSIAPSAAAYGIAPSAYRNSSPLAARAAPASSSLSTVPAAPAGMTSAAPAAAPARYGGGAIASYGGQRLAGYGVQLARVYAQGSGYGPATLAPYQSRRLSSYSAPTASGSPSYGSGRGSIRPVTHAAPRPAAPVPKPLGYATSRRGHVYSRTQAPALATPGSYSAPSAAPAYRSSYGSQRRPTGLYAHGSNVPLSLASTSGTSSAQAVPASSFSNQPSSNLSAPAAYGSTGGSTGGRAYGAGRPAAYYRSDSSSTPSGPKWRQMGAYAAGPLPYSGGSGSASGSARYGGSPPSRAPAYYGSAARL